MTFDRSQRPDPSEHAPYYGKYVKLVSDGDIVATLEAQQAETQAFLRALPAEKAGHRYAPDKWTIAQVVRHVADGERVFSYRALAFARGDATELPGFDENAYAEATPVETLSLVQVLDDFAAVRRATLTLLSGFDAAAWGRGGAANATPVSVRALAWLLAGHELHHRGIIRERYL